MEMFTQNKKKTNNDKFKEQRRKPNQRRKNYDLHDKDKVL